MNTDKSKNPKKKRSGWFWDVIQFFIDLIPICIFFFISTILTSSCNEPSVNNSIEVEVNQKMKNLFDDPSKLDNLQKNQILMQNFNDSGSYDNQGNKDGVWIEYKIQKLFGEVPTQIISNNNDTVIINMTNIIKSTGSYKKNKKVGKWEDFILENKSEPFIWKTKANNFSFRID